MARFFIDTHDGNEEHVDTDGYDLESAEAARRAALRGLAEAIDDTLPDGDHREFSVQVRDETGHLLYRATMKLEGTWADSRHAGPGKS